MSPYFLLISMVLFTCLFAVFYNLFLYLDLFSYLGGLHYE